LDETGWRKRENNNRGRNAGNKCMSKNNMRDKIETKKEEKEWRGTSIGCLILSLISILVSPKKRVSIFSALAWTDDSTIIWEDMILGD
jgi:hypothetical protein